MLNEAVRISKKEVLIFIIWIKDFSCNAKLDKKIYPCKLVLFRECLQDVYLYVWDKYSIFDKIYSANRFNYSLIS